MIDFCYGIKLDTLKDQNLEIYRNWRNNPLIRSWCRQTGLISEVDQLKWHERIQGDQTIRMFEIVADHCVVGVCGLTSIDRQNRSAEFSLYIGPEHHGQGYGEGALKTLLHHGFVDLGLHRIWGETFFANPAMALFLKLGMQKEGTFRDSYFKSGSYIDSHIISMLASDFSKVKQ